MESRIYTKTGDDGTTGLVGGNRVSKSDLRLEAYGTVDELNAWLGLLTTEIETDVTDLLLSIQQNLFIIGSKLATVEKEHRLTVRLNIGESAIRELEQAIDACTGMLPPLRHFIIPGGSSVACRCHIARTVCRRAERRIVQLSENHFVDPLILKYMNRLSDFLFVLSRKLNSDTKNNETYWIGNPGD